MKAVRLIFLGAIFLAALAACTTGTTGSSAMTSNMACWIESAANAASDAYAKAGASSLSSGSLAASALAQSAGYGCNVSPAQPVP